MARAPQSPLLDRLSAAALVALSLVALALPPRCAAASDCQQVSRARLSDGAGREASVQHMQCNEMDRVRVCQGDDCAVDTCDPNASTMLEEMLTAPVEGWIDPLLEVRQGAERHVLVVRRYGQGGYPVITHHRMSDGEPRCQALQDLQTLFIAGEALLREGESFGFRGSMVTVEGSELVLTRPIYLPEDANCCPSGPMVEIRARPEGWSWEVTRIQRLPQRPEAAM